MHLQFENRDYANISESIGAPRSDQRFRAGVNAAIPISQHFSLNGEVTRANHVSNLDAADFDEDCLLAQCLRRFLGRHACAERP